MGRKQQHKVEKPEKVPQADRHKPHRPARVRMALAEALQQFADEQVTDFTEEVNNAVREYLERRKRWPPPS